MRPLRLSVDSIQRAARRHEKPVPPRAAEADISANFREEDLPDALAGGGEDVDAVVAFTDPAHAGPNVAIAVAADAVGEAGDFIPAGLAIKMRLGGNKLA